jgi:hypothetical protein
MNQRTQRYLWGAITLRLKLPIDYSELPKKKGICVWSSAMANEPHQPGSCKPVLHASRFAHSVTFPKANTKRNAVVKTMSCIMAAVKTSITCKNLAMTEALLSTGSIESYVAAKKHCSGATRHITYPYIAKDNALAF